jgi:hypothetical protein
MSACHMLQEWGYRDCDYGVNHTMQHILQECAYSGGFCGLRPRPNFTGQNFTEHNFNAVLKNWTKFHWIEM